MCLAVPMKLIVVKEDGTGVAEMGGTQHEVALSLIDAPQVGEHVIVHAGYAIERLDQAEADERLKLFQELAESYEDGA